MDPQDAIRTFLENYSPSMGTIVAIRVPGVDPGGLDMSAEYVDLMRAMTGEAKC